MATINHEVYEGGTLVRTEEITLPPEQANADTIRDQARQALDTNRTYLALATPTAAQTTAQVKALSRQNVRIIRLLLNLFDGTD